MSVTNLPADFYQEHDHFIVYLASGNSNKCLAALHDRFGEVKNVGLIASSNQDIGEAAYRHFADSSIKFVMVYNSRIFNSQYNNYPIVVYDEGNFSLWSGDSESHAFCAKEAFELAPALFNSELDKFVLNKSQLLDYARTIAYSTFHNLCSGKIMNPYNDPTINDWVEARLEYSEHYSMEMRLKQDNCK